MKKALKITSALCFFVAVAAVIFGIISVATANRSFFVGFAMFGIIRSGNFMGVIGNIFGIMLTVASFGAMGIFGFKGDGRNGFIWSMIASALAVISLIIVIFSKNFTFGDILITALPLAHLFLIYKGAD